MQIIKFLSFFFFCRSIKCENSQKRYTVYERRRPVSTLEQVPLICADVPIFNNQNVSDYELLFAITRTDSTNV